MSLPTDPKTRKGMPIFSGLINYFPHACAAVAELSRIGNDQHNPGQPMHWAKEKSTDHPDALLRHLTDMAIDETHRDPDGCLAAVKAAWRALANLESMYDRGVDIFYQKPQEEVPLQDFLISVDEASINGQKISLDDATEEDWNALSRQRGFGMSGGLE